MQSIHPQVKLIIFERSGHEIFMDEPDKFFKELIDFMKTAEMPSRLKITVFKKDILNKENDRCRLGNEKIK